MSGGGGAEGDPNAILDETSQSSVTKAKNYEMSMLDQIKQVTSETLLEYKWPLEGRNSEHYFLQEQVCEFLDIKSFKRRYPDVPRRKINHEERDFLVEIRAVSETQVNSSQRIFLYKKRRKCSPVRVTTHLSCAIY